VVVCLEQGADLHMAQLMPLPLTVSCFSEIQIGFTFLVLAHLGSPGKRAVKRVCVCVYVRARTRTRTCARTCMRACVRVCIQCCNWQYNVNEAIYNKKTKKKIIILIS